MNSNANAFASQEIFYVICVAFIILAVLGTFLQGLSLLILSSLVDRSGSLSPFGNFDLLWVYPHV